MTAFTVTEIPVELEPVTADPFIEALGDGYSGPLRHGPVIAHVIPSPAWSAGVPVASPYRLTRTVSPSGLRQTPASSELLNTF